MAKVAFICAQCGRDGSREAGDYNRKQRQAVAMHCSQACSHAAMRARATAEAQARSRACETCGKMFSPRQYQLRVGQGRFCSQKCNKAFHNASQRPEVWEARVVTMREKRARGEWATTVGERNGNWKGGREEALRRRRESGKEAAWLRAYRAKNKDKVREFGARRAGRKLGRLEYGTIPRLRKLQRDRCAICQRNIAKDYTLDHIVPLAKGGRHCAANVQLLCPSCNFRKSDRDPIKHMQSLGRLL